MFRKESEKGNLIYSFPQSTSITSEITGTHFLLHHTLSLLLPTLQNWTFLKPRWEWKLICHLIFNKLKTSQWHSQSVCMCVPEESLRNPQMEIKHGIKRCICLSWSTEKTEPFRRGKGERGRPFAPRDAEQVFVSKQPETAQDPSHLGLPLY